MANSVPFRLNRNGLLLALVSAAFAGEAGAAGGRVEFATTGATVSGTDGQQRPLTKGVELGSGDTIRTDEGGRAQIRFPDGAFVSLQPNTEFSIKEYSFDGKTDGTERGFFALAKGAMRTVTGLIGRVNKTRYQISTPTATIGIRGTGGRIEVLLDGSTLIAGTSGIWTLTNPSGTLDVPAGRFGRAPAAPNQPPRQTLVGPNTGPAPTPPMPPMNTQPPYSEADNRTKDGETKTVVDNTPPPAPTVPQVQPLVSGSGYAAAVAYVPNSSAGATAQSNLDAVFISTGQLTNIQMSPPSFGFGFELASGSHSDFGTDGILAWGRWIGSVNQACDCTNPQVYGPNSGLHYVVGVPTAVMPTGGDAVYNMMGATRPTYTDGSGIGTLTSATLNVTFGIGTTTITGASLSVAMPDAVYNASTPPMSATTTSLSTFSLSMTATGGTCGACGCSTNASGFFAGTNAERAGLAYAIYDTKTVTGAAALKKQ